METEKSHGLLIAGTAIIHDAKLDGLVKSHKSVTPAKARVYNYLKLMDLHLRGDDNKEGFSVIPAKAGPSLFK